MKLEHRISNDWQETMINGSRNKKRALSMLRARILSSKIESGEVLYLKDEEIYDIILDMINKRKASIKKASGQKQLKFISREALEIIILDHYLPNSVI